MCDSQSAPREVTRRTALLAGGGTVLVAAAVVTTIAVTHQNADSTASAFGVNQGGIARPHTPQPHGLISVFDFTDVTSTDFAATLRERLRAISATIARCTSLTGFDRDLTPAGPDDLTVTIGLGPRAISAVDSGLSGAADLPSFAGEELLAETDRGGDLLVAVYASNPQVLHVVTDTVIGGLKNVVPRWHQLGQRAKGVGFVARNPLGHKDGIIVPNSAAELAENVWLRDGPLAHGTICVIRRLRLRVADFRSETIRRQGEIIGRHKIDGSPLSGGGPDAEIDVHAKTAEGELLIPVGAHVRAAHPSFTGSALMLRRGYSFDNGAQKLDDGTTIHDRGLLFISFQRDLDAFVKTQYRLDEKDELQGFVTPTASATFLILPGFTATVPLGQGL